MVPAATFTPNNTSKINSVEDKKKLLKNNHNKSLTAFQIEISNTFAAFVLLLLKKKIVILSILYQCSHKLIEFWLA